MKIVQINGTYGNADSTGRNVKELNDFLLSKGYDSCIYATKVNDGSDAGENVHFFSSDKDKKCHGFLSRLTGHQGYFSHNSTKKLISDLKKEKPDAVILNVLHSNCINMPMLCEYLAEDDVATILVLHDCWYFTGHCCYYVSAGCEKWKENCGSCPQIRNWNKSWFFDFSSKHLKNKAQWFGSIPRLAVVGVSEWIANEAKQSILKNAKIISHIYNWIDLETFKPQDTKALRAQLGIAEDTKVLIGVASGWSERKGLKELIMLAEKLPQAKIIMIGNMPKDITLPQNVLAVGTVKDPKLLAQYYTMADCFVNPSVQETFGKTTAEALSCGTPVVVYNTTACPELVGEGCGKVVPAFDKEQFVESVLQQIYETASDTQRICRSFARDNFESGKCLEKYEELINAVCGKK